MVFDAQEERFRRFVENNQVLGYGNMMDMISRMWYQIDPVGALKVGEAYGSVKERVFDNRYHVTIRNGDGGFVREGDFGANSVEHCFEEVLKTWVIGDENMAIHIHLIGKNALENAEQQFIR